MNLLVDPFQYVSGSQAALSIGRERENRQPFGDVFLHPISQPGSGFGVLLHRFGQIPLGGRPVRGVEDGANVIGDFRLPFPARYVRLGVLLQVKLAALPGNAAEHRLPGGLETGVVIADDELHPTQATCDQALQKGEPVNFLFAEGDRDAQNAPLAYWIDPAGDQNGRVADLSILAYLLIAGIQEQVDDLTQRSLALGS